MRYEIKFRIQSDKDAMVDTMTVTAETEKDALAQLKKNVIGRPKVVAIKQISKVHLSEFEENLAKEAFENAIEHIDSALVSEKGKELYTDDREFASNRIIVRLAEMFDDRVETNY